MKNVLTPRFLHYLIGHEGERVIAHCLDYDVIASADTQDEAIRRLNFLVRSFVETSAIQNNAVALSHRAPEHLWQCFEKMNPADMKFLNLEMAKATDRDPQVHVGVLAVECEPAYALQ